MPVSKRGDAYGRTYTGSCTNEVSKRGNRI